MIVRVSLRDGTYHEVKLFYFGVSGVSVLIFLGRISDTATLRTAKERLQRSRKLRRRELPMRSSVL